MPLVSCRGSEFRSESALSHVPLGNICCCRDQNSVEIRRIPLSDAVRSSSLLITCALADASAKSAHHPAYPRGAHFGVCRRICRIGLAGGGDVKACRAGRKHPPSQVDRPSTEMQVEAAIAVVKRFGDRGIKLAVMVDSSYVEDGVQGNALKWRANGWLTVQGPITNMDLWIELMKCLDQAVAAIVWIKVLSHADIPGYGMRNSTAPVMR